MVDILSHPDPMYWTTHPDVAQVVDVRNFKAPTGEEDCTVAFGVVTVDRAGRGVVRTAYKLDEIELAHLARGGTLWLSCWGGLPVHMLEVQPPAGATP